MREWPRYDNEKWPTPVPKPTISGTGDEHTDDHRKIAMRTFS